MKDHGVAVVLVIGQLGKWLVAIDAVPAGINAFRRAYELEDLPS